MKYFWVVAVFLFNIVLEKIETKGLYFAQKRTKKLKKGNFFCGASKKIKKKLKILILYFLEILKLRFQIKKSYFFYEKKLKKNLSEIKNALYLQRI